ncbi:hypothetical protein DOTSEDRAFT_24324 [Dothistroma septosporum NZE10]|uniref:Uncharacterized protein n=1 Tax=Dothistroma septosporum (strain NZE10 / CBS 128990) TaxID=675120 RepID=N1PMV8_DOTSN|nr:hypothetical protein DOTSEDRAFT_24324 [Dothistroma septosporum NZE10]
MDAQILMIKRQFTKLHHKMKAVKNRNEDEENSTSPQIPAYPPPLAHPPPSAYSARLAHPVPRVRSQLHAIRPPPSPSTDPNMRAQRMVAPTARARAVDHSIDPAIHEPLREISHNIVTDAMPAPLAMHPFKAQGHLQRPVPRKPLTAIAPTAKWRRGVPAMRSTQIPLDAAMSLDSVAQYLPVPPKYDDGGAHLGRIPTPDLFKKPKKRLPAEQKMEDMDEIFPDLPSQAADKASTKLVCGRERKVEAQDWIADLSIADIEATLSDGHESSCHAPTSNLGTLQQLPGELRNKIYRLLAVSSDGEVNIALKTGECDQGRCTHREAGKIVPGLANSCRQLRHEIMPIFCAENKTFHFDYRTVAERCTVGYLSTLGNYIDLIQEYKFDMARPCWAGQQFLGDATYTFTLMTPAISPTKKWHLQQEFKISDELRTAIAAVVPPVTVDVICQCELVKMTIGLSGQNSKYGHDSTKGCGLMALRIASAARFADYVFELKRSKQFMWALPDCKVCNKVRFGPATNP